MKIEGCLRVLGSDVVVVSEPPFLVVMARKESRDDTGDLLNPPKLFVVCYSEQDDQAEILPVEWRVADTLAPQEMRRLGKRMWEQRGVFADARNIAAE